MNNETESTDHGCDANCTSPAEQLNLDCFCTTLNRNQLNTILSVDDINQNILKTHPQLFSNTTVFISPEQLLQMQNIVQAVSRVVNLPAYVKQILVHSPGIANYNPGTSGVFMGYDFHLGARGPQIIEINTNAGGAFLNAALVNAQNECCRAVGRQIIQLKTDLDHEYMEMFLHEWKLQRGDKPLVSIAIVDENPTQQFLYREFKMAQRLFQRNGIKTFIADPSELTFSENQLTYSGQLIDLIYNRHTDFSLASNALADIRKAFESSSVVLTPNPYHHAIYADKRNLAILGNEHNLRELGVQEQDIQVLRAGIPATECVSLENAEKLWAERKHLFFKPASGFGSRATYRGDKLTKRVWNEILLGNYVAQEFVLPSERGILVDNERTALKMDIRAYVYQADMQLLAARLYQGQTTNFRTQGGGFAPVFVA
ncbi:MAG: hypothetical protein EOO52_14140 [Gammaproteobacteria bacterium]|nr:MAG: hypothetical protein EOO52_14140 [Gammaproteobacteria bacterium]